MFHRHRCWMWFPGCFDQLVPRQSFQSIQTWQVFALSIRNRYKRKQSPADNNLRATCAFDYSPHRRRRTRRRPRSPLACKWGPWFKWHFNILTHPLCTALKGCFLGPIGGKRRAFTITSLKLGPDRKANHKPQGAQGRQENSRRPQTDTFAFELRMIITKGRPQSDKSPDRKQGNTRFWVEKSIPWWCSADSPLLWRWPSAQDFAA